MAVPQLQWSAAEVSGGVLTVPIEGDRPKGWKSRFQTVVTLLGGGSWSEVACRSGKVSVTGVVEGSEESLHHFLEAAIQETNAAFDTGDEHGEPDAEDETPDEDADDGDARMTAAFRNFGG